MRRLALCFLFLAVPATAHSQFRHDSSGLVIQPPDFMLRQGEDLLAPMSLISCWYGPATEEYTWVKMCAERLDELPPRVDEKLTFQWEGGTARGSRTRMTVGSEEVVLYSALLELRQGPVRLDVVTPVSGAEEGKAVMDEALASVRDVGILTMERAAQRPSDDRSARYAARAAGKFGMILIFVGVGKWLHERRSRKQQSENGGVAA